MITLFHRTNGVFQWIQKSEIAEIPKNMKIVISQMLAIIFIPYLTVVWDFPEMLCSTYDIIVKAQNTIAKVQLLFFKNDLSWPEMTSVDLY